ncbi:MAG: hypothetical protein Q7K54_01140 [Candidatus Parcubacteria bacterium]|nr:hypothetical protein [Candidatus Parcubacteria bacterium]
MKNTTLVIGIIIALFVGMGAGFSFGKGSSNNGSETNKLKDAVVMMKEQSVGIQKMGEMMISSGIAMQEMGMKYKDDEMTNKGKDLEMVGKNYIEENTKSTEEDTSMKESMN